MPNWVSNLLILRPEDAKKIDPFLTDVENTNDRCIDFEKVIPAPATVYQGPLTTKAHGVECAEDMTLEEFREKYPHGGWYDWNCNNWGTKWNASNGSYHPPEDGDVYGTLWFNTAWSLPTPICINLHDERKIDFIHYYVEEGGWFLGATPYTDDVTYPEYLDDPNGEYEPDAIHEMVEGDSQYGYYFNDEFALNDWCISQIRTFRNSLNQGSSAKAAEGKVPALSLEIVNELNRLSAIISEGAWEDEYKFSNFVRECQSFNITLMPNVTLIDYAEMKDWILIRNLIYSLDKRTSDLRAKSLDLKVGLTVERCNEMIDNYRFNRILEDREFAKLPTFTIDSVIGRRIVFSQFLFRHGSESIEYKLTMLLSKIRHKNLFAPRPMDFAENKDHLIVDAIVDTARAMMELYNEIPTMSPEEFIRLLEVYAKTNMFQLNDEYVYVAPKESEKEINEALRRLNVVRFKNHVHIGNADDRLLFNQIL